MCYCGNAHAERVPCPAPNDVTMAKPLYQPPVLERLKCWLRNLPSRPFQFALWYVSRTIRKDPELFRAWHANIAMPIYDATRPQCLHQCEVPLNWNRAHCPPADSKCQIHQAFTIPRRFECRDMSIEQANYIADRLMLHLFNAGQPSGSKHNTSPPIQGIQPPRSDG